jgi:hypothetical protein
MNTSAVVSRQPHRQPWTLERLVHERAIALGSAIEPSSAASYSSALNSYLAFCSMHNRPVEPTVDTLSFFVVYMCHQIKPQSVEVYLSGICNQLEPYFPNIRDLRHHRIVTKTLTGCKKIQAVGVIRKRPLLRLELVEVCQYYLPVSSHDDALFVSLLLTGFQALMRLGELVWPDKLRLQDYRKVILRQSVTFLPSGFSFFLPGHKADRVFEGNRLILQKTTTLDDPFSPFCEYLSSRD